MVDDVACDMAGNVTGDVAGDLAAYSSFNVIYLFKLSLLFFRHTHICACVHLHVEARDQRCISSSVTLHLMLGDCVSRPSGAH